MCSKTKKPLRRHFAIVNTTAQSVAGAGEQGKHWIVVDFDGRLPDTHAFTVYAWDPMDSDRLLRPFLRICHENNIKVQHTFLGHEKDGWTCGYRALAFISILARTDSHVDLGAITLPPMEHGFVEEVQLVLKDMVAREQDIIDQEIQGIAAGHLLCPSRKSCGLHKFSIVAMKRKSFGLKLP